MLGDLSLTSGASSLDWQLINYAFQLASHYCCAVDCSETLDIESSNG